LQKEKYDLLIEARGDIRDLLLIVSRLKSKVKLSYAFGGGEYLLTHVVPFNEIKHRVDYHLDLVRFLGCQTDTFDGNIYLEHSEIDKIDRLLTASNIQGQFITVHPGSRLPLKTWSPDRYAQLCNRMNSHFSLPILMLGAPNEKELADKIISDLNFVPINLVGQLSLRELAALLSRSLLFVCNDSAPMHMAAAMKTATVAIFGPSKSEETKPYGSISRVVEKDFLCRKSCDESNCRHTSYQACMKAISVDDVFDAVKDLMFEFK
jgi:ADP-heptose:LPS heptosyltransferase